MYVVLSGNTGTGKSSFGSFLCAELKKQFDIEYIDEKSFHHDLLQEMFDRPTDYAFLIQTNFLLQRTLKIQYLTGCNRKFLMERSLEEDFLFAYRHYQLKNITPAEFKVYEAFWHDCMSRVPSPSLFIYLYSEDPAVLAERVVEGSKCGDRRQELPQSDLEEYIRQMNTIYNQWFTDLTKEKIKTPFVQGDLKEDENVARILETVKLLLDSPQAKQSE